MRLLDGGLGRWLFRLAGLGLEVEQQSAPAAGERTEVLLGQLGIGTLTGIRLPPTRRAL